MKMLIKWQSGILNDFGDNKKKVIELRYGLSDGKEYTFKEIANDLAKSDARISQMTMYVRSKFLEKNKRNEIFSCIHKPSEKFIRAYFNKNDVFEMDNQQLSDDDKEELMNILNEEKKKKNVVPKEEVKTDEQKVLDMPIEELEFSARTIATLKRKGWNFVGDLAEKNLKDFNDTRGLGKKGIDEIIEKLDELGIKLEEQKEKITEENSDENGKRVRRALSELRGQREKMQELDEKIDELKKQQAKGLEGEDGR